MAARDVDKQAANNGVAKMPGGITGKGWVPGRSGNPKGRPPLDRCTGDLIRDLLAQAELVTTDKAGNPVVKQLPPGKTLRHLLAEVIVKHALKGDHRFVKELLDRVDGKVPDAVELSGPGGGAIEIDDKARAAAGRKLAAWRKQQQQKLRNLRRPPGTPPTSSTPTG